jgi:hypothetical protein
LDRLDGSIVRISDFAVAIVDTDFIDVASFSDSVLMLCRCDDDIVDSIGLTSKRARPQCIIVSLDFGNAKVMVRLDYRR